MLVDAGSDRQGPPKSAPVLQAKKEQSFAFSTDDVTLEWGTLEMAAHHRKCTTLWPLVEMDTHACAEASVTEAPQSQLTGLITSGAHGHHSDASCNCSAEGHLYFLTMSQINMKIFIQVFLFLK